ncbi:SAM-dependent methyltransferase [Nocardia transvalensis]|uniref:SAM-dependent methyltransferase n=1 Tax=Nocardia transvalensis TaxID=37333 RepID=A0A7W9UG49_9NOCA|nr:SAM-dependent methyltransferase [Nocardia transvalensis]MBB5911701.1 SAM-dependent methyltransferase [Nocardia transvalensis]
MERTPDWSPDDIDPSVPSSARMYDYVLGGFNNFAVDRTLADWVAETMPEVAQGARDNRAFLRRLVTYLVREAGIRQFLDLGSGIPTAGNVHEIAQRLEPGTRVAYVDIDPVAVTVSRRLLAGNPDATAVRGDLTDVESILGDPEIRALLDFTRPIAVLLVSVLHFVPESAEPRAIIARLRKALAPGSFLAISHFTQDGREAEAQRIVAMSRQTPTVTTPRTYAQVERLFEGLTLVEPGLVDVSEWRPEEPGEQVTGSGWYGGAGKVC